MKGRNVLYIALFLVTLLFMISVSGATINLNVDSDDVSTTFSDYVNASKDAPIFDGDIQNYGGYDSCDFKRINSRNCLMDFDFLGEIDSPTKNVINGAVSYCYLEIIAKSARNGISVDVYLRPLVANWSEGVGTDVYVSTGNVTYLNNFTDESWNVPHGDYEIGDTAFNQTINAADVGLVNAGNIGNWSLDNTFCLALLNGTYYGFGIDIGSSAENTAYYVATLENMVYQHPKLIVTLTYTTSNLNYSVLAFYEDSVVEGLFTNYSLNLSADASLVDQANATFFYNGVPYELTISQYNTSSDFVFEQSVEVPIDLPKNNQYIADAYWYYEMNSTAGQNFSGVVNITDQLVNLTFPSFGLCNATVTNLVVNYSVVDEQNKTVLPANMDASFNYFLYGRPSTSQSYSYSNSGLFDYSFCSDLAGTYDVTPSITYSSTDYGQRHFSQEDALYSNSIVNLSLLLSNNAILARFRTQDQFQVPVSGVQIVMQDADNVTVEVEITDSSGLATFFVNPNDYYWFTFSKIGYSNIVNYQRITSSDIFTVQMGTPESVTVGSIQGLSYYFSPSGSNLNQNSIYSFAFNLTSSIWNVSGCVFSILDENYTILTDTYDVFDNDPATFNDSMCGALINYNVTDYGTIILQGLIEENSTTNVSFQHRYGVKSFYQGKYSLLTALNDMKKLSGAGWGSFTLMILAFIIIVAMVANVSEYINMSNPEVLVVFIWCLIFAFSWLGWFGSSNGVVDSDISGWIDKWFIALITGLITAGYVIWRHL